MSDNLKQDLMKEFQKQFPESPLEIMDESKLAKIPGYINSGNLALNWIISKDIKGGLPMGRVVLLSGDSASGKSMIALSMMRDPEIDLIIYLDSEGGGVSDEFAKFLGIDPKKILYNPIETIEDLISKMKFIIDSIEKNKAAKNVLMVIDSVSMLTTEREKDPTGGQDMGNKAKQTRVFFRQYARKLQKLNICVVMTAHLTDNIGGYGPAKVVSGGTILQYMPSVEVRFAKVNKESETEQSAKGMSLVKIRAEIIKSRLGTTGKRVKFDLDMQNGLDEYAGLFDILKDYEFIIPAASDHEAQITEQNIPKRSTGWWMFKAWHDEIVGDRVLNLYNRMKDEGLTSSGKFREDQVKTFCKEYEWFLNEIRELLLAIYINSETESETQKETNVSDKTEEESKNEDETEVEEKPKKRTRKKNVEVVEVS